MSAGAVARGRFELVFDVGCALEGWDLSNFVIERRVRIAAAGRRGFLNQKLMYAGRDLTLEGFCLTDASPALCAAWLELAPGLRALMRQVRPTRLETTLAGKLEGMSEVVDLLHAFDASVPYLSGSSPTPPRLVRSRLTGRDQRAMLTALSSLRESPLSMPSDYTVMFRPRRPRRTREGWLHRPYITAFPEGIVVGVLIWTNEFDTATRRAGEAAVKRLRRASFTGNFARSRDRAGLHGVFTRRVRTRARLIDAVQFVSGFSVSSTVSSRTAPPTDRT